MTIQRVPNVPFSQIANSALRDTRLSFKARGVLALALSNTGEWNATRNYFESMSDKDGRESAQSALNELTALGYRRVVKVRREDGTITSEVHWFHDSTDGRETRLAVYTPDGNPVGIRTPSLEDHLENTSKTKSLAPIGAVDDGFDVFWAAYPLKKGKADALKAWKRIPKDVPRDVIVAAASSYANWLNAHPDPPKTKWAQGWLTGQRWEDELETPRDSSRKTAAQSRDEYLAGIFANSAAIDNNTTPTRLEISR